MRPEPSIAWLWIALALPLGACSTIAGAPPRSTSTDALANEDPAYKTAIEDFYKLDASNEDGRRKVRNQFVETRIAVIDHEYLKFRQSLYQGRVGADLGADLALLSFGALGAAVSSAGAKTTYAALSAAVVGGKTSIDKNVYFERTVSALLAQMDTLRNNKKIDLFDGLTKPIANYPLSYAKSETDEYYLAGTIARAIQAVNSVTAAASNDSENKLREQIKKTLEAGGVRVANAALSDPGKALLACYSIEANRQAMNDYLKNEIGYPRSLTEFTLEEATIPKRAAMLERMRAQNRCL